MNDDTNSPVPMVRVYINERGVSVPAGAVALDAVRAQSPDDADAIEAGRQQLADSRGLPIDASVPLVNGAIFRVIGVRHRADAAAADAGVNAGVDAASATDVA